MSSYPAFNAMKVFSEGEAEDDGADDTDAAQIYGAKVESQISLKVEPFAFPDGDADGYFAPNAASDDEVERMVHAAAPTLSNEPVQVASLEPVDPSRFSDMLAMPHAYEPGSAFRVIEENVSISMPDERRARYQEEIIPFRDTKPIAGGAGRKRISGRRRAARRRAADRSARHQGAGCRQRHPRRRGHDRRTPRGSCASRSIAACSTS